MSDEKFVINGDRLKRFCELSVNVLIKDALRKETYARGNQMPFFTKELSKEIMTRSRLRKKYLKNRNEENRAIYVKQRNYCVSLILRLFWKTMKPSLSNKIVTRDRIHLTENGEVVRTQLETESILNSIGDSI